MKNGDEDEEGEILSSHLHELLIFYPSLACFRVAPVTELSSSFRAYVEVYFNFLSMPLNAESEPRLLFRLGRCSESESRVKLDDKQFLKFISARRL